MSFIIMFRLISSKISKSTSRFSFVWLLFSLKILRARPWMVEIWGNSTRFGKLSLILSLKFLAAESINVRTKMFSGKMFWLKSFIISASIIVVFPAPATALTAILPSLYSRTGAWSGLGIILNSFFIGSWVSPSVFVFECDSLKKWLMPLKFSIPRKSYMLE